MMIHDQLLSTQLLMNVKNEHSRLLNSPPTHSFHGHSSSVAGLNMDLYSAYAFQAHLQQQRQHQEQEHQHQQQQQQQQKQLLLREAPEVLDLSRRCDSVETPRKTPSPYQTNSSTTGTPPLLSPTNSINKHTTSFLPNSQPLYPMLYFPHSMKPELGSSGAPTTTSNSSEKTTMTGSTLPPSTLLQTFASMAAVAQQPAISPKSDSNQNNSLNKMNTPSTKSTAGSTEVKNTRPFKAFPRDPLVIAANFAATDVLLDNPRVERYTEYRKRVLEQIRNSNGGSRTVTNPKMRRTSSRSNCISEAANNNLQSENEGTVDEYSDCDSNVGNFERISHSMNSSTSSIDIDSNNNNNGSVSTTTNTDKNNTVSKTNSSSSSSCGTLKDAAYYERRRKNNAAAKKSRDRRRIKEDEIAIRAAYLERQNIELLCQIDALKSQLAAYTSKMVGV